MRKTKQNKKIKKATTTKININKVDQQKKEPQLLASTQLKNKQLGNYKALFSYLLSSHPDSELADEF